MNTKIRLAKGEELEEIYKLEKLWKKEGISPNAILSTKKDLAKAINEKRVLIALVDEIPVGFLLYKFWSEKSAELDEVYVMKRFRHNKIGRKLIQRFFKIKRIKACKEIWLHADSKEEAKLLKFYEQFGFKKVAVTMLKKQRKKKV